MKCLAFSVLASGAMTPRVRLRDQLKGAPRPPVLLPCGPTSPSPAFSSPFPSLPFVLHSPLLPPHRMATCVDLYLLPSTKAFLRRGRPHHTQTHSVCGRQKNTGSWRTSVTTPIPLLLPPHRPIDPLLKKSVVVGERMLAAPPSNTSPQPTPAPNRVSALF